MKQQSSFMPLGDIASGCLELVGRALLEFFVNEIGGMIWRWCQMVGEFVVWLITFGRVRLDYRSPIAAGLVGIFVHAAVIAVVSYWIMNTPR